MEQKYPTSLGYMFFYGIAAAASIVFSFIAYVGILTSAINRENYSDEYSNTHHYGLLIIPAIGVGIAALIIINLIIRRVTLSSDAVSYRSIWGYKEMPTDNIKGFRIGDKAISIFSTDSAQRKIHIRDYTSISDIKDVRQWLTENFKNLDTLEFEAAKEELLQDTNFGVTKEAREETFNKYRKYNITYNLVAVGLFWVPVVLGIFNVYLSVLLFLFPLTGILLMAGSKGLIRLYAKKNSAYSPIFIGLFFASMGLVLQSTICVKILSYDKLWEPACIMAILTCAVLFYLSVVKTKDVLLNQIFFVLMVGCIYAFGITVMINCAFDSSPQRVYPATITGKYVSHGKSTTYHVQLGDCDGFKGTEQITVSWSYYNRASIGSTIKIDIKQGTFGAPWFRIDDY
jgi:hypothetical protein